MPDTQETGVVILDEIVASKGREIEALLGREKELERRVSRAGPARDFLAALSCGERVAVIPEVKRRSPGAGPIRPELDPASLAGDYAQGGAAAISVLTDHPYFGGSLDDLVRVRERVELPVLRKDFLIDERQLLAARVSGADAVLLIVRILPPVRLAALWSLANDLGMAALVEVHDAGELQIALETGARVLGINNRDLGTFETNLRVTEELAPDVPSDVVLVSESGIRSVDDVGRVGRAGVDAVLVGEALVRRGDPAAATRALASTPRSPR